RDVSFSVNEGDRLGIIGSNGAGKTSLLRVLTGEYEADSGSVFIARDCTVGYLSQNTALTARTDRTTLFSYLLEAFDDVLAIEESILSLEAELAATPTGDAARIAALSAALEDAHRRYREEEGATVRGRCRAILLRMGFSEEEIERPISTLSGGQATRLVLSRLVAEEPDILLLDEPTNHLDADALAWLEEFLAAYKKTVIVVSHDRYFLDRVTNKTLLILRGEGRLFPGNYSKYRLLVAEEEASQTRRYKEQQKEIARIEANIAFQRRCGQAHNFVTIRAKQKQLDRIDRVEAVKGPEKSIRLAFSGEQSGEEVLTVRKLSFAYPSAAPLFSDLSFSVRRGERILFLGNNGCGKSTLLRLLCGLLDRTAGRIDFGYHVEIGYYDQENRRLSEENTVLEELAASYPAMTNTELRSALARFLFDADDVAKRVHDLSGGERARLTLCKLILRSVNLLILDEPTNHLDIASREALEEALDGFPGTILAVSHDRYFIDRVASRIIELSPAGMQDYPLSESENPYVTYLALRAASAEEAPKTEVLQDTEKENRREEYEARKREAARRRGDERRLEAARRRVPEIEARLDAIKTELFGDAASDYVRAAELEAEREALEEELLGLYELIL
ncbi:MAG: ABC-F family ATP-binding cassette domain-containing protein, partial [Clostridia bacterium]|nr:ABC-F family ATP-binding cassette domain-containing protein [Clostridia bacterium]